MSETYDGSQELVCVYEASLVETEMVRSLLESNDVEVALHQAGTGAYPVSVGAMGGGRVMVRAEDRELALEIIRSESDTLDSDEVQSSDGDPGEVLAESGRRPWFFWVAVAIAALMIALIVVEQMQVY